MSNKGFLWVLLGSIAECGWAYGLKHAENLMQFAITAVLVSVSFVSFIKALKYLPVSVSYTVFVGLGAFFIVIAEIVTDLINHAEIPNFIRLFFIATLMIGVLGLKRVRS